MMHALLVTALLVSSVETATSADQLEALTTDVREEEDPGIDPLRLLLDLPQAFIELAFLPLLPVTLAFERWHLLDRFIDLITNDHKTLAIVPIIDPVNSSGLGFGLALLHNDPLGSQDRTSVVALVRTNEDVNASAFIQRRVRFLSGRIVRVGASYSIDHDQRFFGLGGGGSRDAVRRLRVDGANATVGMDLFAASGLGTRFEIAYRRREIRNGTFPGELGVADDDLLTPPTGFGLGLDYPELTIQLQYDTRDAVGRTTTGLVASVEGSITRDVNGGKTGGVRATAQVGGFIELLPLFRVLFVGFGISAATPLRDGEEIPLHHLINLGGGSRLRGHVPDRFIDRLGWWGTAEYRYYFYEYAATGYGASAVLFADVGRVGRDIPDLVQGPIRWSLGLGLRAEHNLLLLGRVQVAVSNEGVRFSIGMGEVL